MQCHAQLLVNVKTKLNKAPTYCSVMFLKSNLSDSQYQLKKAFFFFFVSLKVSEIDGKLKSALVRPPFRDFRHWHKK